MLDSLAAAFYLSIDRRFRAVHGAVQCLFEGFWMGVLPEPVWDLITERSYGAGAEYTNPEYLDSGFHFWEELAIRGSFQPGSRVLVAAAGGGRELIALSRAGFSADGFECSRSMVGAGKRALAERGISATLEWAPPCAVPDRFNSSGVNDPNSVYDALIVGWNGYTYMAPRERRLAFLRKLRTHLQPGSPVLVSCFLRPRGSRSAIWIPRIANAVRRCLLRAPVFVPGDFFSARPRHEFTKRQLEKELQEAGLLPSASYVWGLFGAVICTS